MAKLVDNVIASFDDSFQPTGRVKADPWPHIEMKKLKHRLRLIIEGPDDGEAVARDCLSKAIAAGLIAAVATAFLGVGLGATTAAWEAAQKMLLGCLGSKFSVKIDDDTEWETWWT